jgi:hypothetical protein
MKLEIQRSKTDLHERAKIKRAVIVNWGVFGALDIGISFGIRHLNFGFRGEMNWQMEAALTRRLGSLRYVAPPSWRRVSGASSSGFQDAPSPKWGRDWQWTRRGIGFKVCANPNKKTIINSQ